MPKKKKKKKEKGILSRKPRLFIPLIVYGLEFTVQF